MDILSLVIFILVFGGVVIIHEYGHFIASRLSNIEVEEFGLGLPTPGAYTFWSSKGFFLLKNGKRIEIPANFKLPVSWDELVGNEAKLTIDEADEKSILRSIVSEVVKTEEQKPPVARPAHPLELDHIYVDEKGEVRRFVNIYEGGEDIRFLQNQQTPLKAGDEVSIVPAIAGG